MKKEFSQVLKMRHIYQSINAATYGTVTDVVISGLVSKLYTDEIPAVDTRDGQVVSLLARKTSNKFSCDQIHVWFNNRKGVISFYFLKSFFIDKTYFQF